MGWVRTTVFAGVLATGCFSDPPVIPGEDGSSGSSGTPGSSAQTGLSMTSGDSSGRATSFGSGTDPFGSSSGFIGTGSTTGSPVETVLFDLVDQACGNQVQWVGTINAGTSEPLTCDAAPTTGAVRTEPSFFDIDGVEHGRSVLLRPPEAVPGGHIAGTTAGPLPLLGANAPVFRAELACALGPGNASFLWELNYVRPGGVDNAGGGNHICGSGPGAIEVALDNDDDRPLSFIILVGPNTNIEVGLIDPVVEQNPF